MKHSKPLSAFFALLFSGSMSAQQVAPFTSGDRCSHQGCMARRYEIAGG